MDKALDFYANFWIGIWIIFLLIEDKIGKEEKATISHGYYIFTHVISQFLTMVGFGNFFWTVIIQTIFVFCGFALLYESVYDDTRYCKNTTLQSLLKNFTLVIYVLFGAYSVYKRIKLDKDYLIKTIKNLIDADYKKLLLNVINNEWFKGICIGIISAVAGGLFLNWINKNKDDKK